MIVRSRAPLRLGLAGGGTDVSPYCDIYGGHVMNATIDKHAFAILSEPESGQREFCAIDVGVSEVLGGDEALVPDGPLKLLKGVYARICNEFLGGEPRPLKVQTFSDAPPGSGLGSSSTMVVALVQAFAEYFALPLGEYEVAHLAYDIERKDLGLAGGKQDQYAAAFGGFNFMEFYKDDRVIVNPLRIKDWVWSELEASLVLYFTGVSRASADIIDQQSRNVVEGNRSSIDAMHSLKQEAVQMKECVLRGDLQGLARTLQAGWEAKKNMASSISNPVIEQVERVAFANGAHAAKVSGAGGGGFMMFMCSPDKRIGLTRALAEQGGRLLDFHFTQQGATSWRIM
ncbi:dehydrogenase [Dyella marensis]|jgi:D-glycero-alpha-D-manno-heptose-7-phosphate kinase|uniref:D-glycero-alpha-D-manno-heptose-7-phosphate kinase n=1 Tax=Dyella marensis TaxID=500610 RepID=A0A1I2GAD3_9GAMM|nr:MULTISPECIES: dehydrogenase [Dyella]SFF14138.1 D-glycero-alpha-D-manno-heptose-7-phosphate kinase [Dyella marensis]